MATSPLIVIFGPTASGKSSLAIAIAKEYGGEIICADSRTIYKGMDIGTAKPSKHEQQGIAHWGLDLVVPGEHFSAADFKAYAVQKIMEIRERGNVPILVGGTGLYIDAVIFDYEFGSAPDSKKREQLETMTLGELHEYCKNNNVLLPENDKNKRYVIRAIELHGQSPKRELTPVGNNIIVGITTEKEILRQKIEDRVDVMLQTGVVEEAKKLAALYGWDNTAMASNIYPLIHRYIKNTISLDELKQKASVLDWRLAKRQMTWLKRNSFIHWLPAEQISAYVGDSLAKVYEA